MKCPDCGSSLSMVPFEGGMLSRCFKCGGFWADSAVLNKLSSQQLSSWRRISSRSSWFSGGKGVCPADGMMLSKYKGEEIPQSIMVSRCVRCGKWWFPGDSLFSYKPAAEARISYFRLWGLGSDAKSLLLPMMSVIVLAVATVMGINMVQKQQLVTIGADSGVSDVALTYAGYGKAMVVFKASNPVESIAFKENLTVGWQQVEVEETDGLYKAMISGLVEGREYYFLIGGKEYSLKMK